jgi:hypothetical protein
VPRLERPFRPQRWISPSSKTATREIGDSIGETLLTSRQSKQKLFDRDARLSLQGPVRTPYIAAAAWERSRFRARELGARERPGSLPAASFPKTES